MNKKKYIGIQSGIVTTKVKISDILDWELGKKVIVCETHNYQYFCPKWWVRFLYPEEIYDYYSSPNIEEHEIVWDWDMSDRIEKWKENIILSARKKTSFEFWNTTVRVQGEYLISDENTKIASGKFVEKKYILF
ncbi:hypothetical protein [Lactococcus petauri]|uniref:hypothetical protein n=1 Tax=Lactococcus petauri TaxID=1940789 RepID=UPI0022E05068|nr:hypothetical protein [Lactococcus petauri]